MLTQRRLTLQDFDYYEIHEAFASQVLATLKRGRTRSSARNGSASTHPLGELDRAKLNVNGGSLAAGSSVRGDRRRIVASLAKQLTRTAAAAA
jgi:acetyl-CoA C-acetyltransferase